MYRTGDPRFRRRLNEIGQTLEQAKESGQSGLFIFGQNYVIPCFQSMGSCFTTCIDASCPSLNLTAKERDRIRRQRGRSRGRAEFSFDFYDDLDEDENDALMGWGNDEFDRLLAGGASYGTVSNTQPAKQKGMTYPKARRKSTIQAHDGGPDPTIIPGSSIFGKLFGGKALKYKPDAAGLQDHPGQLRAKDITEGEALLQEGNEGRRKHRRVRSNTVSSGHTTESLSSRGDLFPSDEEDDAIEMDDEFAMVLERRTTLSAPETESSSNKTRSIRERRRGKRPSAGSRTSTISSRSRGGRRRSRTNSSAEQTPIDEVPPNFEEEIPSLSELKHEERQLEAEQEGEVERRRQEAQRLASERGLDENLSSKEATPEVRSPRLTAVKRVDEPSQLPTPLATDDEADESRQADGNQDKGRQDSKAP